MDQIRNVNLKGTTITWEREFKEDPTNWFAVIRTNDTDPHNPKNETFKEAIDSVLENLDVRQDRIREHKPHKIFDETNNPYKYYTEIDEKKFSKTTKYDKLLDNLKETYKMPYKNGKVLGRIV